MPDSVLILILQCDSSKCTSSLLHQGMLMNMQFITHGGAKSQICISTVKKKIIFFPEL